MVRFYLDGWYASRTDPYGMGAEDVAAVMRQRPEVLSALVIKPERGGHGYGILYIATEPLTDWHDAPQWAIDGYGLAVKP